MSERMRRVLITDPDPVVESILSKMDAQQNQTIMGPDGKPLLEPLVDDRTVTYAKDGESYSVEPLELLKRAARMQRDGASLKAIRAELDLMNVSDATLQSALKVGMDLLLADIAAGIEPEESVRVLGYVEVAEDDTNEATPQDALEMGRNLLEGWKADDRARSGD